MHGDEVLTNGIPGHHLSQYSDGWFSKLSQEETARSS